MPELPEVEMFRRLIIEGAKRKKITNVEALDAKVVLSTEEDLRESCLGKKLTASHRHGKNLFLSFGKDVTLWVHFGLTGYPEWSNIKSDVPNSTRLIIQFGNDRLLFIDPRKFGRIELIKDMDAFIKKKRLGEDALQISQEEFNHRIGSFSQSIKGALLDQQRIAGVGNWVADEMLFQAKIPPMKAASEVSSGDLRRLYNQMKKILSTSLEREAERDLLPNSYIVKHRSKNENCPRCGGPLKITEVATRTTYYCPNCQSASAKGTTAKKRGAKKKVRKKPVKKKVA